LSTSQKTFEPEEKTQTEDAVGGKPEDGFNWVDGRTENALVFILEILFGTPKPLKTRTSPISIKVV
jgi:hypothetical protein